jgi:hypothetical protein
MNIRRNSSGDADVAFGLGKLEDIKPGFHEEVVKGDVAAGVFRLSPSAKKDVPQESLSARFGETSEV